MKLDDNSQEGESSESYFLTGSCYALPEHILVLKMFWLKRLSLDSVQKTTPGAAGNLSGGTSFLKWWFVS